MKKKVNEMCTVEGASTRLTFFVCANVVLSLCICAEKVNIMCIKLEVFFCKSGASWRDHAVDVELNFHSF